MKFLPGFIIRTPMFPKGVGVTAAVYDEAVYLASPSLYSDAIKHSKGQLTEKKEIRKLELSTYKYQSRAGTRCTPFGLFAGLHVGSFGEKSTVTFHSDISQTIHRKTRLDMNVLCQIAQEIATKESVRPHLLFSPNNSMYRIGDFYRYVEYYYENNKRVHHISKVDYSDYLEYLFDESFSGKTIDELAALLVSEEITTEEAKAFILELINEQLLISELDPTVTGPEYSEVIFKTLERINSTNQSEEITELLICLREIEADINLIDANRLNDISLYEAAHEKVQRLLPQIPTANLLQTDLFKIPLSSTLIKEIQNNIIESLQFLNRITPPNKQNELNAFAKRFSERYGEREMPLLKVLDTETGIGYLNNEINGVNDLADDVNAVSTSTDSKINWGVLQDIYHKLLTQSIAGSAKEIHLTEKDFDGIDYSTKKLPFSMSVLFKVIDADENVIHLKGSGGASAVNLIGRFGHGSQEVLSIADQIVAHETEQANKAIIASIAHLPQSRTGNVLSRPSIREYEIPYLAKSSTDKEHEIALSDLMISVRNNKVVLRSKRLNKEIIPRLDNSHNFSYNALPVYQFLCDLQIQEFQKSYLGFSWGHFSSKYTFLPRVWYKKTLLSPAKWQFNRSDFKQLIETKDGAERIKRFKEFQLLHQLPDCFLLADGDNELYIDTSSEIAIFAFLDAVKNVFSITLEEFLFNEKAPLVLDQDGNYYSNECVAFLLNDENKLNNKELPVISAVSSPQNFPIGSEWAYFKIYCGAKTADSLLIEKLKPIAAQFLEKKLIDQWFFIRYTDPEFHLRFRVHLTDLAHYGEILAQMNRTFEELVREDIVFKFQVDGYEREINRYGDNSIEIAEQLFFSDSETCLEVLNLLDGNEGNALRWQFALRSVDSFLNEFGLTIEEKQQFTEKLSQLFFEEHGGNRNLKLQLDTKFRKLRPIVEQRLHEDPARNEDIDQLLVLIDQQRTKEQKSISQLLELKAQDALQISLEELISSFIHMKVNRLFLSKQRTNEFLIYDLLARHYKSQVARVKKAVAMSV